MIIFFQNQPGNIYAVETEIPLHGLEINRLTWLFGGAAYLETSKLDGAFIGPRREMVTPWSTNAVEITQNMGVSGIRRIEEFIRSDNTGMPEYDPMLQNVYYSLGQDLFVIDKEPDPVVFIDDVEAYNKQEGLALSPQEISYLEDVSNRIGRKLTDSEIFGFSQVNSEHCRHKIFNGLFVIDGEEKPYSLFQLIKQTTSENPNRVVSAYKDNCAFLRGPVSGQFAPARQDRADWFRVKEVETVLSLKAETHNFPTTVEPFNGAATGTGGEIRDRLAGGKGSVPLAGTAVYMTAYPRTETGRSWENAVLPRPWLYQTPEDILIKASNGASDFGNKFGQPLVCGSLLTFEHREKGKTYGYDKVIMLAGGIGYGKKIDSMKDEPGKGDRIILLGGDNYRIGMGGSAVSSVATGEYGNMIELNAVQRSNPEMQKRVCNAIRAMMESDENPVVSIHDHGAGGHLNCLSELVENSGGKIEMDKLPVGDPTLSAREIAGNESQERMGLVMHEKDVDLLKRVAERERAPMYNIGEVTGDMQFTFEDTVTKIKPIDLQLEWLFGNPPRTVMNDKTTENGFEELVFDEKRFREYLVAVLQLEAVACKDWLTNKVDRSVTGKVALQQTTGKIQLPLNNMAVMAIGYGEERGLATAIGHAPVAAMVDPAKGSVLSIAESLTNILWAPLQDGIRGVSLSANWMWPTRHEGEDSRLYNAVEAASDFAKALGINIPTGKDSLSMTQKYKDNTIVYAPGTVIISAAAEVTDIRKAVTPGLKDVTGSSVLYIDLSKDRFFLGGSSFAQSLNFVGKECPSVMDADYFADAFNALQEMVDKGEVLAGHDVSGGGMITALLEMCFPEKETGIDVNLSAFGENIINVLFSEKPAVLVQVADGQGTINNLAAKGIDAKLIGRYNNVRRFIISHGEESYDLKIDKLRDVWYRSSYLLDRRQSGEDLALERFRNYGKQPLSYKFPSTFTGLFSQYGIDGKRSEPSGIKAAIIREKGVNGDREMAWGMYLAGMDVKDVHMTDLISGRETLEDVNMIVFVGGFSNSDVLGSAKGWAGAFLYNEKAKEALDRFYSRKDTLSLGVCNGCQLMVELGLVGVNKGESTKMLFNDSHKFESLFLNVDIRENNSVMLRSLAGTRLGIWVAHGEGKFSLPAQESEYNIPMKYSYGGYPANPNGSGYDAAAICSADGRHLAMMPHLERSLYPHNWADYPDERKGPARETSDNKTGNDASAVKPAKDSPVRINDEITPWIESFVNAREWIRNMKGN
ncbi:MAG: phosphoribosylformylglycinamidine synthase [Bacteroidales bacterium]